jgi:hypothetical protein
LKTTIACAEAAVDNSSAAVPIATPSGIKRRNTDLAPLGVRIDLENTNNP